MHDELKQEIVGLESARTILQSVLARLELYREALDDANVRIYTGELWRIDPGGGELLEPLGVALERADKKEDDLESEALAFIQVGTHIVGYLPQEANLIPAPGGGKWFWYCADAARDARRAGLSA